MSSKAPTDLDCYASTLQHYARSSFRVLVRQQKAKS